MLSVVEYVVKEPFLARCGIIAAACSEGLFFIVLLGKHQRTHNGR